MAADDADDLVPFQDITVIPGMQVPDLVVAGSGRLQQDSPRVVRDGSRRLLARQG